MSDASEMDTVQEKAQVVLFHASGLSQRQIKEFQYPNRLRLYYTNARAIDKHTQYMRAATTDITPQTSQRMRCSGQHRINQSEQQRDINVIICFARLFPMTAHL